MMAEDAVEFTELPLGRYGRSLLLPKAISNNESAKEQTWSLMDYQPVLVTTGQTELETTLDLSL